MNHEAKQTHYAQLLQKAMDHDEYASSIQKQGDFITAAAEYRKASSLYAKSAMELLEIGQNSNVPEFNRIQENVDQLIDISQTLLNHAAQLEHESSSANKVPRNAELTHEEKDAPVFLPAVKQSVSFEDIAGLNEAKQLVMDEVINPLLHNELYERFHIKNHGGLLLFGPPGNGKTMMARAIATKADMAFFSIRCSDIVGKYFGEAEKHVQALFQAARDAHNAVIFLDEAEALASRRGSSSTVMNRLVPELLTQMDGFERFEGHIIVIFATNRPYDLDPAFLRPGRLSSHCYVPLPNAEIRRHFLQTMIDKLPHQDAIDIEALVLKTEHYSCADLDNLVKKGCQYPINRSIVRKLRGETEPQEYLMQQDLENALASLHPSVEPEELIRLEKWMRKIGMSQSTS